MLINLFQTIRSSGVPCTLRELLDLLGAPDPEPSRAGYGRQTAARTPRGRSRLRPGPNHGRGRWGVVRRRRDPLRDERRRPAPDRLRTAR